MTTQYVYPGPERVFHDAVAADELPGVLERYGYERAFIVCSKTLNRTTDVVSGIRQALRGRCVGLTDAVREHAPVGDVLAVAQMLRDADADVMVSIGGGSVMDLAKFAQLCVTEGVTTREGLEAYRSAARGRFGDMMPVSRAAPAIRHIAVATTLSTGEVTPGGTPVDELTGRKSGYLVRDGAPQVLIYDPDIILHTPRDLLISTGVRGLDHAINTLCGMDPEPLSGLLAAKAAQLFVENLKDVSGPTSTREARSNCQRASFYTGLGQLSVAHGFSHAMVHVIAPLVGAPHSWTACVCMLAQARWQEGHASEQHRMVLELLGRPDARLHEVLHDFLVELGMPTTLAELGFTDDHLDRAIEYGLANEHVVTNNLRPITTAAELRAVLALAA